MSTLEPEHQAILRKQAEKSVRLRLPDYVALHDSVSLSDLEAAVYQAVFKDFNCFETTINAFVHEVLATLAEQALQTHYAEWLQTEMTQHLAQAERNGHTESTVKHVFAALQTDLTTFFLTEYAPNEDQGSFEQCLQQHIETQLIPVSAPTLTPEAIGFLHYKVYQEPLPPSDTRPGPVVLTAKERRVLVFSTFEQLKTKHILPHLGDGHTAVNLRRMISRLRDKISAEAATKNIPFPPLWWKQLTDTDLGNLLDNPAMVNTGDNP